MRARIDWTVALASGWLLGCQAVSGVNDLQIVEGAGEADAGPDVSSEAGGQGGAAGAGGASGAAGVGGGGGMSGGSGSGGSAGGGCPGMMADCDGNSSNGCEVDLATDVNHCGACGDACSTAGGAASCVSGSCSIACNSGFDDCDGNVDTGCETDLSADPMNCGACGARCSTTRSESQQCGSGGVCIHTCSVGFGDCNGPKSAAEDDGCEVDLNDPASCGGCPPFTHCEAFNSTVQTCTNGQCSHTCKSGFSDCNGPLPGAMDDGCECQGTCGSCS